MKTERMGAAGRAELAGACHWQAWLLGREMRAFLHVANVSDARVAMLHTCRKAAAGRSGDG